VKRISAVATKPAQYYKGLRVKADTGLHDQVSNLVRERLASGGTVLDFGCGEGALSARLKDLGYRVLSVDMDRESFRAETDFEQLDFNDREAVESFIDSNRDTFDLVLGIEVIEHVENPWQYIRDLASLTRPGGFIVVSTPNVTSWISRVTFLVKGRFHQFEDSDRSYGHINPVAEDELRLICERSGLVVDDALPGGWLPRLWLSTDPKTLLLRLFGFTASFVMQGTWDGWCLVLVAQKQDAATDA
jgi:2-polyprenyl-3-methyl-5-hydroxy-6-metoxy-1,4-benzoquinol methylase